MWSLVSIGKSLLLHYVCLCSLSCFSRRFRDFAEMNSHVKQNLKGHHLREILPPFPEKPLKSFTDHRDPGFIKDRQQKLEIYLTALVAIPHVSDMLCVKAFVGLLDNVREYSITFHVPTLGFSLAPIGGMNKNNNSFNQDREITSVMVGQIQKQEATSEVVTGDAISKINGIPIAGMTFNCEKLSISFL
jgi:hypothetical protein